MNGDRALQRIAGNVRIHNVQNTVNRFVTACPEDSGAENPASFRIHNNFHEALRLVFFDRAANAGHRAAADQEWSAARSRFAFSHSGASERRINVKRVTWNAVADAPALSGEQIGGD